MDPSFYHLYDDYDSEDEEDCWWKDNPRFEGYTRHEVEQEVTFLRPEYNAETDEFDSEGKNVGWCISNGFEEVEDDHVWSGPWYWRHRGGEEARNQRLALNQQRRKEIVLKRQQLEDSCILRVNEQAFARILNLKKQGNHAFCTGDYARALEYYHETHWQHSHFQEGVFLDGQQRTEKVNILSNQAECHLRLGQHAEAQMDATQALVLDKRHVKSLIRRAKATYRGYVLDDCEFTSMKVNPIAAAQAQQDLEKVIRMGGQGVEEAKKLHETIDATLQKELDRVRPKGKKTNSS